MKIKEYRSQFIQELLSAYDAGEAESFFYLILEKHQLKDRFGFGSELIFRKGIGALEFYLRAAEARDSYSILAGEH
jgi:hypothetical protein